MVAPPRVSANLNSNTPDNEWVIICMEAPEPGVSLCSALQSFFLAVKHNVCLQHDGSAFQTVPICVDWTRCRYFPVDACFIYLVNENNWKIQMEIKSDTWNWNTIYLLYLRLLCHPAYSHFYNCVCVCMCAHFALTGMYSFLSELKADFPGWVHLWDCSVTFQP